MVSDLEWQKINKKIPPTMNNRNHGRLPHPNLLSIAKVSATLKTQQKWQGIALYQE